MLPRAILLLGVLAAACFSEAPQDPTTSTGSATEQPTTTSMTTADTTGGEGSIAACRACQATQCEGYEQGCMDTPGCSICVEEPFDLLCLLNDAFRPLAYCSCDNCDEACEYMCPGGGGVCEDCFTNSCMAELGGCDLESGCTLCLLDPYREGCAENPAFMAVQACACMNCEAPCLWQCESAVGTCGGCFMGGPCSPAFQNCLGNDECDACFANPSTPGCDANAQYEAVGDCVCANCPDQCGLLFECEG